MFDVMVLCGLGVLRGDYPSLTPSPIFKLLITDHPAEPLSRLRVVEKRNAPATALVNFAHPVGVLLAMPDFVGKDFYPFLILKPGNERSHGRAVGAFSPKEFHQVGLGFPALSIHLVWDAEEPKSSRLKLLNSEFKSQK
jgi:hypothetical protein